MHPFGSALPQHPPEPDGALSSSGIWAGQAHTVHNPISAAVTLLTAKNTFPSFKLKEEAEPGVKLELRSPQAGLEGGPASPWELLRAQTLEPKGGLETWKPLSE